MPRIPRRPAFEKLHERELLAYGDIDQQFGNDGEFSFFITTQFETPVELDQVVANDGQTFWRAGFRGDVGMLVKFESDGTPDVSFDDDGYATYRLLNAERTLFHEVRQLSTGRVIVVGSAEFTQSSRPFVAQFLPTGELAEDFGTNGVFQGGLEHRFQLVATPNDHIILAQTFTETVFTPDRETRMSLLKLQPDGQIDESFGENGSTQSVIAIRATSEDGRRGGAPNFEHAAMTEERMLLTHREFDPNREQFVLQTHAYTFEGERDNSFANLGVAEHVMEPGEPRLYLQTYVTDNKFLFFQIDQDTENRQVNLGLLDLESGIDTNFGQAGYLRFTTGVNDSRQSLLAIEGGFFLIFNDRDTTKTVRFDLAGQLDESHGEGGVSTIPLVSHDRIMQLSNQILLFEEDDHLSFIRSMNMNGTLNSDFGEEGVQEFRNDERLVFVNDFQLSTIPQSEFFVSSGGRLDWQNGWYFGFDMQAKGFSDRLLGVRTDHEAISEPAVVTVTPRGNLLAARSDYSREKNFYIDRYSPNGSLEETYSIATDFDEVGLNAQKWIHAGDGFIYALLGGYDAQELRHGAMLARFDAFGFLDEDFGTDGFLLFPNTTERATDLVVAADSLNILFRSQSNIDAIFVSTIQPDGTLSQLVELLSDVDNKHVDDVMVQEERLIILARVDGQSKLFGYDLSWNLDPQFGNNGVRDLPFSVAHQDFQGILLKHYDSILIGRTTDGPFQSIEVVVTDEQGIPRREFGQDGMTNIDISNGDDRFIGFGPLVDGSFLVGMESRTDRGVVGNVVRVEGPSQNPNPWHYVMNPLNVSANQGDDTVSALDALLVINHLNVPTTTPSDYVDTNGDGHFSAIDALRVINFLNFGRGEGESSFDPDQAFDVTWDWYANLEEEQDRILNPLTE